MSRSCRSQEAAESQFRTNADSPVSGATQLQLCFSFLRSLEIGSTHLRLDTNYCFSARTSPGGMVLVMSVETTEIITVWFAGRTYRPIANSQLELCPKRQNTASYTSGLSAASLVPPIRVHYGELRYERLATPV